MTGSDARREQQWKEFGEGLRTIFGIAQSRGTFKDQADLARKSNGELTAQWISGAFNGNKITTPKLLKFLSLIEVGDQTARRHLARLTELRSNATIDDEVQERFRRWRADRSSRSELRHLLSAAALGNLLDQVTDGHIVGGQDLWAYFVVSAIHAEPGAGSDYRRWFRLADEARQPDDDQQRVAESLVEQLVDQHGAPRWRAALLLENLPPRPRAAVPPFAQSLVGSQVERDRTVDLVLKMLLQEIPRQGVKDLLHLEEMLPEAIREMLLQEAGQQGAMSAFGRMQDFIDPPGSGGGRMDAIAAVAMARERLKTYRDFSWLVQRIRRRFDAGDVEGLLGPDSPDEGLDLQVGNIARLPGVTSEVQAVVDQIAALLRSWMHSGSADTDRGTEEVVALLREFDTLCQLDIAGSLQDPT